MYFSLDRKGVRIRAGGNEIPRMATLPALMMLEPLGSSHPIIQHQFAKRR